MQKLFEQDCVDSQTSRVCVRSRKWTKYAFYLFQNKTINLARLFRNWVMFIGLIPSRTGIAIGHLVNAQLHHITGKI